VRINRHREGSAATETGYRGQAVESHPPTLVLLLRVRGLPCCCSGLCHTLTKFALISRRVTSIRVRYSRMCRVSRKFSRTNSRAVAPIRSMLSW